MYSKIKDRAPITEGEWRETETARSISRIVYYLSVEVFVPCERTVDNFS